MSRTAANMTTGPFAVFIAGTEVGHTEGDVTFNDGLQQRERKSAQAGENVLDLIVTGHQPTMQFGIAERTLANIQAVYPEFASAGTSLYFGRTPGYMLSTGAKRVLFRPVGATDQLRDIVLFKAVIQAREEVGLNVENDTVYRITLLGLYDEARTDTKRIGYVGKPAA